MQGYKYFDNPLFPVMVKSLGFAIDKLMRFFLSLFIVDIVSIFVYEISILSSFELKSS